LFFCLGFTKTTPRQKPKRERPGGETLPGLSYMVWILSL